jgi:hypothetical protein
MDAKKLVVTYRQIREAVQADHERSMEAARDAAAASAPDDPLAQARFLAGLNAALAELEAAEDDPEVMSTPRHPMASQLQSFIAEQARAGNTSQPPAPLPEGLEVKFDNNDWLGWMGSFFTWWRKIHPHALVAGDPAAASIPNAYRVALISDWGTGLYGAPFSAKSIDADNDPRGYQLLLHLGDVYYSGTEGEIKDRFLADWPARGGAISRTLNGNHEMYTGGQAYFDVALKRFNQAASYFALRNDFWTLVCLDTAYAEHDLADPQRAWLDQVLATNTSQRVIFFSHHQPFSLLDSRARLRLVLGPRAPMRRVRQAPDLQDARSLRGPRRLPRIPRRHRRRRRGSKRAGHGRLQMAPARREESRAERNHPRRPESIREGSRARVPAARLPDARIRQRPPEGNLSAARRYGRPHPNAMTLTPDLEALRARAERWVVHDDAPRVAARVRAIVGPGGDALAAQGGVGALAADALAALKQGNEPTPTQLAALETMIRIMRPAPRSIGGTLEDLAPESQADFPQWSAFQAKVRPLLHSIGRINDASGAGIGTGFLAGGAVLVTNHHVLTALSHGSDRLERGQARVQFVHEFNTPDEPPVDITGVVAVHPTLDAVLLEIDAVPPRPPLTINTAPVAAGMPIAAIGYPFRDPIRNPLFVDAIFGDQYGIKRASPGEVIGTGPSAVYHDCSTLGGNSGSPLLSLADATVVGLHRDGYFTYRNEAVAGASLRAFVDALVP